MMTNEQVNAKLQTRLQGMTPDQLEAALAIELSAAEHNPPEWHAALQIAEHLGLIRAEIMRRQEAEEAGRALRGAQTQAAHIASHVHALVMRHLGGQGLWGTRLLEATDAVAEAARQAILRELMEGQGQK